jgi:NAD(P)-dependent dehydrogenase (short-subunit alcohol dehydrogenase family)
MTEKVWMITGAARGLGAEIAKAVLDGGDKLIATARDVQALTPLGSPDNLLAIGMDVTSEEQVRSGVREGLRRFGRIDVLVNNAGFGLLGAVEETTAEEVERIYGTNVFGLLRVTRAVLPSMRQQRSGHIMNFASLGGYRASAGWGCVLLHQVCRGGADRSPA